MFYLGTIRIKNLCIFSLYKNFEKRTKGVAAFISNCKAAERNKWVEGLMAAGLEIDHYGNCWKNVNLQEKKNGDQSWQGRIIFICLFVHGIL